MTVQTDGVLNCLLTPLQCAVYDKQMCVVAVKLLYTFLFFFLFFFFSRERGVSVKLKKSITVKELFKYFDRCSVVEKLADSIKDLVIAL